MDIAAETNSGWEAIERLTLLFAPTLNRYGQNKRAVPYEDSPSGTRGKSVAPARTYKLIFQGS